MRRGIGSVYTGDWQIDILPALNGGKDVKSLRL
jgi:hypothetical protein